MKTPLRTKTNLPRAQHAAIRALIEFRKRNPYAPTYTELAELLGVKEFAARFSIGELVEKGLVTVVPRKSRSMSVTPAGKTAAELPVREARPSPTAAVADPTVRKTSRPVGQPVARTA